MKKILQLGDPSLEKKSKPVLDPKSAETQKLIADLVKICKAKSKTAGGLAAPQIGVNKNIFIVRRVDIEEKYQQKGKKIPKEVKNKIWHPMINTKIVKKGTKKTTFWEGCLSVDKGDLFGPVTRPSFVKVKYLNRYGREKELTAVDFLAHELQHELDHLNGVLFVKYVENPENLWKGKDLDDYIKKNAKVPDIV